MKWILLIGMIFSLQGMATVTVGTENCPIHFEGKVKEIIEPVGAIDFFSTNKVIFENHQNVKGEAHSLVTIDVLRNGPFKVEADKDYRVQIRDSKLCWIEEI